MSKVLFVLILAAGLAGAQNAGNVEKGKALFIKNKCYSCHGYDGHGGGAGVKLAPKPIARAALIAYVRHPAVGTMPTFSAKVISDADLTDIHAYLASIPDPPAVKDIPLLNQ
jgi:mono/diheme cytochrome c family protein